MDESINKDKSFLQSIKMDISRSFSLITYERLAMHKILAILKSEAGLNILLKDLDKGPDVRASAISCLVKFDSQKIIPEFITLMNKDIPWHEKLQLLKYIVEHGNINNVPEIIGFIDKNISNPEMGPCMYEAFMALKMLGKKSNDVLSYLISIVTSDVHSVEIKCHAINALSPFRVISTFEGLLKKDNDELSNAVYRAIYDLNIDMTDSIVVEDTDESRLYTYSEKNEDKIFLDIRVILGKMTHRFDTLSNRGKVSFICAMISCNHRELQIHVMKALNSKDQELINMTLFALYANINRVRDPDNLFRNLIALTSDCEIDNELIIGIFEKYFKNVKNTRQFNILRDKLYSYIVVTLETYFETYRKEFMITGVVEKNYPISFQKIRKFIVDRFTGELKRKLIEFLMYEEPSSLKNMLGELSGHVKFLSEEEKEPMTYLIEILMDKDKKSREISASRMDDLNFDKRYLREKIIRICLIISRLAIGEASSTLVNIYNYLKKYPDTAITGITINTLSRLNYSYMLGEIEVQLNTGTEEEQLQNLQYLSYFTEQRSLNILLEFIRNRISNESEILEMAVNILIERDILFNTAANQVLKKIVDNNRNLDIIKLTILGVGKCGISADIEFLDSLFFKFQDNEVKEHILRSIGTIITVSTGFEKRIVIKNLKEYLKDPGIKVRVYACLLLVKLGFKDALKSIKDMLIIKNKSIQREILTILGDLRSLELSFFLISLLKEEYGMTDDIISALEMLPREELQEIDGFIVNLFRKFDASELEQIPGPGSEDARGREIIRSQKIIVMTIDIYSGEGERELQDLTNINLRICHTLIKGAVLDNKGIIARMTNKRVLAFFYDLMSSINAALLISENMKSFSKARIINRQVELSVQLISGEYRFLNEELIDTPIASAYEMNLRALINRVIIGKSVYEEVKTKFIVEKISEFIFRGSSSLMEFYDLHNPINFSAFVNEIIDRKTSEEHEKEMINTQLEAELKKLKLRSKSPSSAAIARELENIGVKINNQLKEIDVYVQRRSTDRELIKNVRKMLTNVQNLYKVEVSRIMID